ncbi:MAG: acylphosphatase [Mariprofundus sp.]|nr:acylphosphatase [Mariprofundus sp.]
MPQQCILAHIQGRVQAVGFRYYTHLKANELGLHGWVRNLPDGSVETCLSGDTLPLQSMQNWLAHGPPAAEVTAISYSTGDCSELAQSFEIR